jgi:hypothetical protein
MLRRPSKVDWQSATVLHVHDETADARPGPFVSCRDDHNRISRASITLFA